MKLAAIIGALAAFILALPVEGQAPESILRDYTNDIEGDPDQPVRVRLTSSKSLKVGRMAGIWGTVGGTDSADAVFLGKTPDHARMRFDLTVLDGSTARVLVTAKDGNTVARHELTAKAGENSQQWLRLKGRIVVQVMSADPNSATYALYFWYPGDTVDALTNGELDKVQAFEGKGRPSMLRSKTQMPRGKEGDEK